MKKKALTQNIQISVVLPVYNEQNNIEALSREIISVLGNLQFSRLELVFVNDGSIDNSLQIIKQLSANDKRIKYIDLSRNFGHQIAITAGIEATKGERIVIMDADFQDPPALIADLSKKMDEGFDVVYARRLTRRGDSVFKKTTARLFYRTLSLITRSKIPVDTGDFRIINRKVANILMKMPEQQKFLRGQIAWIGMKQTSVDFIRDKRSEGKSGYSLKKMWRFAIDGITSFSDFPLKFATYLGFIFSIVSFILIIWALYQRLVAREYVQGWTSLILSILFIGGIQLVSMGIIGEYISRIGNNVRNRPLYIINETNTDDGDNDTDEEDSST
ncbi:MAG TPA: glycosyltransferase family 2 protein [Bacteroidales bacterium]|nr:glycosyltransferase family 2 protein [Bacteroidales bacterium]